VQPSTIPEEPPSTIPQGQPSTTVEFSSIADEQIDLSTEPERNLSRKDKDTLEIRVNDVTDPVRWFIDGVELNDPGASITVSAVDYPIGVHHVTALVYRNGIPYTNELIFTVTE
jgi:hypothetical protein